VSDRSSATSSVEGVGKLDGSKARIGWPVTANRPVADASGAYENSFAGRAVDAWSSADKQ
jgi:hypothetical protein